MNSLALPLRAGVEPAARSGGLDDDILVDTILPLFGVGPALVVGRDADDSAATLRRRGVSTTRLDRSALTALPFGDGAFHAVVICDVLEYERPDALDPIARELHRVSARYLFVRVSTKATGRTEPLTTEWSRQRWEDCFLQAGFMRHPLGFNAVSYEALESEGPQILLTFERLPVGVDHRVSLAELKVERNLHMDMLRESGRRADAHIARYHLAARFVRPGDRVLDAACGLGYGSAVLYDGTLARSVEGLDNSAYAVEYARAECGAHRPRTSFVCGDITNLEQRTAGSVDVVVSFETMEHIEDPEAFVRNVARLLTPGGRLICSVPNLWVDETGTDPNPYHLHVFHRDKLLDVCGRFLRIEQLFGQTAGNGFKKTDERRRLTPVALSDRETNPEWWVLVAVKRPDGPDTCEDDERQWLSRALVNTEHGIVSPDLRLAEARLVLDGSADLSPDRGAALWVLAQGGLERALPVDIGLAKAIARYCSAESGCPEVQRWQIAVEHTLAKWHMASGAMREAERLFARTALRDCLDCLPVPIDTVDAAFWCGWLCVQRNAASEATQWWARGLDETRRVASASRSLDADTLARLFDVAARCDQGLVMLNEFGDRPGMAAAHTFRTLTASADLSARQLAAATRTARQAVEQATQARAQYDAAVAAAAANARTAAAQAEAARQALHHVIAERDARIASLSRALVRLAIRDPRGVVVFGAGQGGRNAIARLRSLGAHVSYVVDNREAVWDTEVERVLVLAPARLRLDPFALIVIASSVGRDDIAHQLTELGFAAGEHFISSETLW